MDLNDVKDNFRNLVSRFPPLDNVDISRIWESVKRECQNLRQRI
jgi:hypothetical protein